jgi:PTS system mannose-specific IID component
VTGLPPIEGEPAPAAEPTRPRLRSRDLARASSRSLYLQAFFTPDRMQGIGFLFSILPVLDRLYAGEERAAALRRHSGYFNTHPVLAGHVLGAVARLEERRARGEDVPAERIETVKRGLASPLAALGDPLFWVTLRPLAGLVGVLALGFLPGAEVSGPDLRVLLCPLAVLLTYNAVALPFRATGVSRGYALADRPLELVRSLRLAEWRRMLERAGAFVWGAVGALVLAVLAESLSHTRPGGAAHVLPLAAGAAAALGVLGRWPGRLVEAALAAVALATLLSFPL